ncbi:F-box domain-containing protein, partial [Dactylonectria estremocensis]
MPHTISYTANGRSRPDKLTPFPDKLLVRIFEAVGEASKHDLCTVSRLNHRYHALADAVLYKTVHFLTPELHILFSESLKRRPRRGSIIHGIKLAYPAPELSTGDQTKHLDTRQVDTLPQIISTMSNLEVLDIEVPDKLLHGMGHLFNGPFDLACLKECTLSYSNEDNQYWDLQESIHVFAHPTLDTLVIKRAKLDDKGFDMIERPHDTALRVLHLIECDINDDALSDLLMFPKALKEFVMTQAEEPMPELEESSDNIRDYIMALRSANHTLESITIDHPSLLGLRALSLRDFIELKTFRINHDYQLLGKSSKRPRTHSVGLAAELETIEFFNELGTDEEVTDLLVYTIQNIHITARKLKSLIVVPGDDGVPKELVEACAAQPQLELHVIGEMDGI